MSGSGSHDHVLTRAITGVVLIGVAARAFAYLSNRSLWLDEAMIALNIGQRSFGELIGRLDFNQAAPLGFLWLEKLAVVALGPGERALRLWPLLASFATLVVFAILARRLLGPLAAVGTLALLALSTSQVYYGAEVKQYAFDVLCAAALLLVPLGRSSRVPEGAGVDPASRWWALGLAGALAVWFSHPAVFLLPGVALYVATAPRRGSGSWRPLLMVGVSWGLSFALAYSASAREASTSPLMAQFWADGFMPLLPASREDLAWFGGAAAGWIRGTFDFSETVSPVRTAAIWVGGILAGLGAVRAWVGRRREVCLVALPILLALVASALRRYPFEGRLILFLVPSTLLLMGWGLDATATLARARTKRVGGVLAWSVTAAMPSLAAVVLVAWLANPRREELRPVLQALAGRARPDDVVYMHSGAQHAHLYYERACETCRIDARVVRGAFPLEDAAAIEAEIARLPPEGRVWMVFSHSWWGYGDIERRLLVEQLGERAIRVDSVTAVGARAYSFDFGGTE